MSVYKGDKARRKWPRLHERSKATAAARNSYLIGKALIQTEGGWRRSESGNPTRVLRGLSISVYRTADGLWAFVRSQIRGPAKYLVTGFKTRDEAKAAATHFSALPPSDTL